jgi:hypothetical protein
MTGRRLQLTLIGAIVTVVTACSSPPDSGYVISKRYEAPYTYFTNQCVLYDSKTYLCKVSVPIPNTEPAHWKLKIKDPDTSKEGWVEVSQSMYDRYNDGQHWPDPAS